MYSTSVHLLIYLYVTLFLFFIYLTTVFVADARWRLLVE